MIYFGGNRTINGTTDDDVIVAYAGSNYIINGLGGNDTILAAYGDYEIVTTLLTGYNYIVLGGYGDVVTTGSATVVGTVTNSTITINSGKVAIAGAGNTIMSNVAAPTDKLTVFALDGNTKIEAVIEADIYIGGSNNGVSTGVGQIQSAIEGVVNVSGGTGYNTFNLIATTGKLVTDGAFNHVSASYSGTWDITPGSGYDQVVFGLNNLAPYLVGTVHLSGTDNGVEGFATNVTITGGAGYNTVMMDSDPAVAVAYRDIELPGLHNGIALMNGVSHVDAGDGSDTVLINGGYAELVFRGSGDMLFINDPFPSRRGIPHSASVAVTGTHDGLQIYLGDNQTYPSPTDGIKLDIYTFGGTDVLHIAGGGGFSSRDAVVAALQPDGGGGYSLSLPRSFVHFDAGSQLSAANFALS